MSVLLSLQGVCRDEEMQKYLPFVIDCRFYTDVRVSEFGVRDNVLNFEEGGLLETHGSSQFIKVD